MAGPLVPDALWALIAPLLPEHPPRPKGGRPPVDDRKALEGIVFVLRTGAGPSPHRNCSQPLFPVHRFWYGWKM
jgi:transposase